MLARSALREAVICARWSVAHGSTHRFVRLSTTHRVPALTQFTRERDGTISDPGATFVLGQERSRSTRSTVRSRTSAPFAQSDQRESSLGEWLIPPMLGTKIMP